MSFWDYFKDRAKKVVNNQVDNFRVGMNTSIRPQAGKVANVAQGLVQGGGKAINTGIGTANRLVRSPQLQQVSRFIPNSSLRLGIQGLGNQKTTQFVDRNKQTLERLAPQTTAGKVGAFIGENAVYGAVPFVPELGAAKFAAKPLSRLASAGIQRGAEGALTSGAIKFGQGQDIKSIAREMPREAVTGALINTALSPRLVKKAYNSTLGKKTSNVLSFAGANPGADALSNEARKYKTPSEALKARGIKGDSLLDAEDFIDEVKSNGGRVNNDGTVTVYHRTTSEAKSQIDQTGKMFGKEDGIFFSTAKTGQADGFGDDIVELNIPIEKLQLDDVFGNEAHLKLGARINEPVDISKYRTSQPLAPQSTQGATNSQGIPLSNPKNISPETQRIAIKGQQPVSERTLPTSPEARIPIRVNQKVSSFGDSLPLNPKNVNGISGDILPIKKANHDVETLNLIKEAIDAGDVGAARSIYDSSPAKKLPSFNEILKKQRSSNFVGEVSDDLSGRMNKYLAAQEEFDLLNSVDGRGLTIPDVKKIMKSKIAQKADFDLTKIPGFDDFAQGYRDALGMSDANDDAILDLIMKSPSKSQVKSLKPPTIRIKNNSRIPISSRGKDTNIPIKISETAKDTSGNQLLLSGKTGNLNPEQAKSIYKNSGKSVPFVNQLKGNDKPIVTYTGLNFAERTTKEGNKVPLFAKSGALVDKELQEAIVDAVERNKDKPLLSLHNQSPVRNIEDIFGDKANVIKSYLPERAATNEASRVKWLDSEVSQLRNEVKDLGIKFNSPEDKLGQRYAEKRMSLEELQRELPDTWQNAKAYAEIARNKYDSYLEQINKSLTDAGYNPVPKRADYVTHLNELSVADNMFGGLFNIPKEKLPAVMNMIHLQTKPGKQWFRFGIERKNGPFVESITNALDAYIPSASKQIFHTDTAQSARTFEKTLMATLEDNPQSKALSNFAKWSTDYVNHLTGKGSIIDRSVEGTVGRQIPAAIDWLRRRSSANMVGANISSAITNFIPLTQSFATTSKVAVGKGISASFASGFQKLPNKIDGIESGFLTRRFAGKDKITQTFGGEVLDKASWLFSAIDKFVSNTVVSGKYFEGLEKGLSKAQAMKQADDYAARLITDRSFGQLPTLYNSKTMGLITQFQAEVNNQLSFLGKDLPKMAKGNGLQMASMLGQVALYSYAYNSLFEKIAGRRPAIDPIGFALQTIETLNNEDSSAQEKAKKIVEEASNPLPYAGLVTGGGRVPALDVIPNPYAVLTGDSTVKKELKKGYYLVPPTGGGQIRKSVEGTMAYNRGSSDTDKGQVRFPIEQNTSNRIKTSVFGQYAVPEAKQYFKDNNKPLSDDQSAIFKELGADKKSYDFIKQMSADEKTKKEERDKMIDSIINGSKKPEGMLLKDWNSLLGSAEDKVIKSALSPIEKKLYDMSEDNRNSLTQSNPQLASAVEKVNAIKSSSSDKKVSLPRITLKKASSGKKGKIKISKAPKFKNISKPKVKEYKLKIKRIG